MYKILICEDEENIVSFLKTELLYDGFEADVAYDGEEALFLFTKNDYDLVLLDIMLPLKNGLECLREIRKKSLIPVIILTARKEVYDKVAFLNAGADDYVTKPFDTLELIARIKRNINRTEKIKLETSFEVKSETNLVIQEDNYQAFIDREEIVLTKTEFEILLYLHKNINKVKTRDEIIHAVFGDFYGESNIIDVNIKSTAQLKIFTTLLFIAVILLLYFMLMSSINSYLLKQGIDMNISMKFELILILIITAILAYVISSVIIDKVYNPIRQMNFSKPLIINSEDEDLMDYVRAFNNMSENLRIHIERQKRFISDVSHELTTPITIINGHVDLLMHHYKEKPVLIESELKIIKTEALRMEDLVDSLLLLSRSDSGQQKYSFDYVKVSKLIKDSVSEAEIVAPDFTFNISIEEDAIIKCDEYALCRVMRIFLSNAVKYSGDSRLIHVNAYESHGLINVSVRDNGIGVTFTKSSSI